MSQVKHSANMRYYISTGIYHCLILDMNTRFCENIETSRTSADKRFLMFCIPSVLNSGS